jgi:hypothetical protein
MSKSDDVTEEDPILVEFDKEVFIFVNEAFHALANPIK